MIEVTITYPGQDEGASDRMRAVDLGNGLAELRGHAVMVPLAPGDVVRVDEVGEVTGVERLARLFTDEIDFHMPANLRPYQTADPKAVAKVEAQIEAWHRQGFDQQHRAPGAPSSIRIETS